ncbi:E3 ubiquitin-protein ligase ubr11 [Fulvia fulva]|uniref:E3 ubiquitin-protein ligase n=1 Tax=Passalora fulva TaxID=5499 RepID=A0A9Q8PFG5_PASFU|nr:E3 ubiquitin-protein ligase ubr11 [Fulvia fulva]KAK4613371.1 E3 ubiquitin-protein ligase ubr11 [Fulvia fulva]UJO21513.1 E3 ubiquitin-protein ligase ubr11 [Fulvia fulva]WPV20357.1 E3 ubiquitin-protein ligase ubr11 [Fulvia fulva]WPV35073.1 E3 ubiquitin-protein ligase ubr11 [Fulvia fulva]
MQSSPEEQLANHLAAQPANFDNRFTHSANCDLRQILFKSLAAQRQDYLRLFFPDGPPPDRSKPWSLSDAQGAIEGAEYTPAAKGTACGHIFKNGESTYHCKTCAADDTCVLCAKCFESSDHEGHGVLISVSPGNSGCCDCGDREAWKRDVKCSIHTADVNEEAQGGNVHGKQKASVGSLGSALPPDLVEAIRMTIARCVDYLCDVFSCSPEQLRMPKSQTSILRDERESRLEGVYGDEQQEQNLEYCLVLWNDEKHTVDDVQNQVARACSNTKRFGFQKAMEVNDVGRSIVHYSRDLEELLRMAEIIEQLKVTVTIRSARDIFREEQCAIIIHWISDIAGCSVGNEPYLLRNIVCEELLKPWRESSITTNKDIGRDGIDDHEQDENEKTQRKYRALLQPLRAAANVVRLEVEIQDPMDDDEDDNEDNDNEEDEEEEGDEFYMEVAEGPDDMDVEVGDLRRASEAATNSLDAADMDIDIMEENDELGEATIAGYPPPAPPPPRGERRTIFTPQDSDERENNEHQPPARRDPYPRVPATPKARFTRLTRPSKHWLEKPDGYKAPRPSEPCEDLWQRVRLDWLILYDLRLWKTLRIHLRHLYITTVVTIPHFKRILGLRFAGLYTTLAQLYLIADREPDHSIINLSVQMLTTPTITQEVVERGNFLTNLMAILYSFITTRQVGFPQDINPQATLAFDAGAVTNRRMFHFFLDLRWLFQSEFIHYRMRYEPRYLLQFLDLVKLHQGVCPNVRATGEHIEYESDTWISASMIVKEINKLCKQVAVSFEPHHKFDDGNASLQRAVRNVAQVTMINSFGYERKRFATAELKDDLAWHQIGPLVHDGKKYSVPRHAVQSEPMSFHHPLHYLLSWLIENAKGMSRDEMRSLLCFSPADLRDPWNATPKGGAAPSSLTGDELLSAIFEHPLRVCAWLAQMKAGMWVRNGITLRHQAHTYKSVSHRDVGYQRDILMVQAGLVLCGADDELPGERFLAQMIDRFQMDDWILGDYQIVPGYEESQQLDVFEDFFHLLVIALSERGNLQPHLGSEEQHARMLQHDIAHSLCFKPLSFSELNQRVTEKVGESDDFQRVLECMTNYRAPEGLQDTGTFELKPEYIELVDPFFAHYTRNQREEAENVYRKYTARKTGKKVEDIVYETRLEPIESGMFTHLAAFTNTPLFVQLAASALQFALHVKEAAPKVQVTRVETFLHMVLHLILLAVVEDRSGAEDGFVKLASSVTCNFAANSFIPHETATTLVSLLLSVGVMDDYTACHPAIKNVLRKMQMRHPEKLSAIGALGAMLDRGDSSSPASLSLEDKERKKQEALARQAKVMAKMKEQQNNFLQNQGMAFGDELDDFEDDMSITEEPEKVEHRKTWSFPTGTCILCQEETDENRLYGTFAFFGDSNILRTTPVEDPDYLDEVFRIPPSLDRSADNIRPFGVAGDNKRDVQRIGPDGKATTVERQGLSKGFPHQSGGNKGPVSTSCGHIMHYNCFEQYLAATSRRHGSQIARKHPERIDLKEFICPLCKALGNTFLPIVWKEKNCTPEHEVHAAKNLSDWLASVHEDYPVDYSFLNAASTAMQHHQQVSEIYSDRAAQYVTSMFAPTLIQNFNDLSLDNTTSPVSPTQARYPLRRGHTLSRLFGLNYGNNAATAAQSEIISHSAEMLRFSDLLSAYRRCEDSIKANKLIPVDDGVLRNDNPTVALSRALGMTITAFEISHRGMGNDPLATSLVSDFSEQNLTHLRILSETIESHLAVNMLRSGSSTIAKETIRRRDLAMAQLIGNGRDYDHDLEDHSFRLNSKLLFQDDIFLFFADWLALLGPNVAEANSIMQLCYWAEIVKVLFVLRPFFANQPFVPKPAEALPDRRFIDAVSRTNWGPGLNRFGLQRLVDLRQLVEKYALAFLRKCAVLMVVRYGLDFECPYNIDPSAPEIDRLTSLLHINSIDDLCGLYLAEDKSGHNLREITDRWIEQAHHVEDQGRGIIRTPHPAIYELVGLPKNYDTLTEAAIKCRCPTTGKEVQDPAVCLLCGEIFCSQAVCCMVEKNLGGCYQHMRKHGLKTGIFINIRKCMVLFCHGPGTGSFAHAPYLDRHGEPDPTLRRHHQLFLNQRRYDKLLREVWLGHMVPSVISRKLEADINPGGWETL